MLYRSFIIKRKQPFDKIERLKQSQLEAEGTYLDMCKETFPKGEDLGHDFFDDNFDDKDIKS